MIEININDMNIFEKLQNNITKSYNVMDYETPSLKVYNTFEKAWVTFKDLKVTSFKPSGEVQISDISKYVAKDSSNYYNFNISENIVVKPKSFALVIVEAEADEVNEISYGASPVIQMLETFTLARNNGFIFEYKDKANKNGIYAILSGFSYEQEAQNGNYFYIKITCNFKEIFDFNLSSDFVSSTTAITKVDSQDYSGFESLSTKSLEARNIAKAEEPTTLRLNKQETYLIDLNLNVNNFYNIQTQIYIEKLSLILWFKYNDFEDKFYVEILSEGVLIYNGIVRFNSKIPSAFGWEEAASNNLKPLGSFVFLPKSGTKTGFIGKEDFLNKKFNLFYLTLSY